MSAPTPGFRLASDERPPVAAHTHCALASGSPYTGRDYMAAMVEARRERDDLSSKLMAESIDAHEWLEALAKAVGIQTGRESWWDSNEAQQRAKVLERIKRLRANAGDVPRPLRTDSRKET